MEAYKYTLRYCFGVLNLNRKRFFVVYHEKHLTFCFLNTNMIEPCLVGNKDLFPSRFLPSQSKTSNK